MLLSKIILACFFAIVDNFIQVMLKSRKFWKGRKILELDILPPTPQPCFLQALQVRIIKN